MNRITEDPKQMNGTPCIRGLRIPVATVIACLAAGMTWDEVLHAYPDLERDDIVEALRYAQQTIRAPRDAWVYVEAATEALSADVEPGLPRARWIEGYVAGRSRSE